MADHDDLGRHMEEIALAIMGEPNRRQSTKQKLRWGSNGSFAVDIQKGTAYDHEAQEGGGALWLIEKQLGLTGKDAFDWMKNEGFLARDDDMRSSTHDRKPAPRGKPDESREKQGGGARPKREIAATYDYIDADENLIYQVVRWEWVEEGKKKKTFSQRRPAPDGSWIWGLDEGEYMRRGPGSDWYRYDEERYSKWRCTETMKVETAVTHQLYQLPTIIEAISMGVVVCIVEGEKDAETLKSWGVPATTNSGGAKYWGEEHTKYLHGADVVIIPDNDKAGREGASLKARSLQGVAKRVRMLDLSRHVRDFEAKGDVTDWRDRYGGNVDALYDLFDALDDWKDIDPNYKPHFKLAMWSDLETQPEPHEWLIEDLVTRKELAMIAGASQAGKTFFTLDLAMSVARGAPFMGQPTIRGGVVYQAGEGVRGLRGLRIPAYKKRYGLTARDNIPFALIPSPVNLYSSDTDVEALIADVRYAASMMDSPLELVIIDTFSAATPGANENSSEDVSLALKRCEIIRERLNCAVIIVHHMNAEGTKARGHTSLGANVDSVLICHLIPDARDDNGRKLREVEVYKLKDGEAGTRIPFVLDPEILYVREDGKEITSCTIERIDRPQSNRRPKKPSGISLTDQVYIYLKSVEKACREHGVPSPHDEIPSDALIADVEIVGRIFAETWFEEETDPEKMQSTLRQARKRAGEKLVALGLIGKKGKWVWRTKKSLSGDVTEDPMNVTPPPPRQEKSDETLDRLSDEWRNLPDWDGLG